MPEETVIPAKTQENIAAPEEGTTATESATEEQQESQEAKPDGVQKRIDKAVRAQREAEREREFWKQEALKGRPAPAETPKPQTVTEPSEDDFQTHAEYVKALTKYTAAQAVEEFRASQRTDSAKTQQAKALQDFVAKEQDFRAKTPDFDEVMADAADLQATDAVIAEIVSSGPELKYYLAKNPDEVERLNKLAPLQLAREVGRIESRFTTSQEIKPAKTTTAPPPPNPTAKSSATSTKDPGDMSPSEYRAWRAKQNAK